MNKYNKKLFSLIIFLPFIFLSCKNKKSNVITDNQFKIVGKITTNGKDTIFNGEIKFFDRLTNNLVFVSNYKNGLLEGASKEYFANGKLKQKVSYSRGIQNGTTEDYDSTTGKLLTVSNYYFGLPCGPQISYIGNFDSIYRFSSLENYPLYSCKFRGDSLCEESGSLLNYFVLQNNEAKRYSEFSLFFYIIEPPQKLLTYKIFDKNLISGDSSLLKKVNGKDGFFYRMRLKKPQSNHKYLFSIEAYYYNNKKKLENIVSDKKREIILPL